MAVGGEQDGDWAAGLVAADPVGFYAGGDLSSWYYYLVLFFLFNIFTFDLSYLICFFIMVCVVWRTLFIPVCV